MKIDIGYSMGYAGTDTEWTEDIPEEVIEEGQDAIAAYIEEMKDAIYNEACEKISIWVNVQQ
jgi:hypothetical protein